MQLTVLMSVLNGEAYLEPAVRSIMDQTYTDFRFEIIDNGSTDSTPRLLAAFAAEDQRIEIVTHTETVTLVEARAQGIERAPTPWVALMDADDIAEPERLEKQMALLDVEGDTIGALGTYARYINAEGKIVGDMVTGPKSKAEFEAAMAADEAMIIVDPSAVIHRQTFVDLGGYRAEYTPAGDLDLWYRIGESGRQVRAIPEFLMRYRIHSGAQSVSKTMLQRARSHFINHNMRRRRRGEAERTLEEFEAWLATQPRQRLRWWFNDMGMTYYKRAGLAYGGGDMVGFARNLGIGLALKPQMLWARLIPQLMARLRRG